MKNSTIFVMNQKAITRTFPSHDKKQVGAWQSPPHYRTNVMNDKLDI